MAGVAADGHRSGTDRRRTGLARPHGDASRPAGYSGELNVGMIGPAAGTSTAGASTAGASAAGAADVVVSEVRRRVRWRDLRGASAASVDDSGVGGTSVLVVTSESDLSSATAVCSGPAGWSPSSG